MKRTATILAFVLAAESISGCATVAAVLPDVISAVTDGAQILDAIESFMRLVFVAHPDPDTEAKVAAALAKARTALNVALRTAQGAKDVTDERVDQAFEEFKQAYLELLALCRPYGVTPAKLPHARMATSGQTLQVPEPLAFRLTRGSR